MIDIFNNDAYLQKTLSDAVNKSKFTPSRIGQLGLFQEQGVLTTSVAVEEKEGILSLISPSARGGPGTTLGNGKRTMRAFNVPHFEIDGALYSETVQNVRAFGFENVAETVAMKVEELLGSYSQSMEATLEHQRMGAIKGVITYADSSSLDLFSEFGVSQESEVDFDLDNANPTSGALAKKCREVIRKINDNLEGAPAAGIHAFCGDAFMDDLIAHPEYRDLYKATPNAQQLGAANVSGGSSYGFVDFGGIRFENYRGYVGSTSYIDTNKVHIFPVGVNGLFKTYFGPADWDGAANTLGQRLYARQWAMDNGKGINLAVQMNALSICTRPKALIKGKRT